MATKEMHHLIIGENEFEVVDASSRSDIGELQTDMADVKDDVTDLQGAVQIAQSDIADLKEDVSDLQEDTDATETKTGSSITFSGALAGAKMRKLIVDLPLVQAGSGVPSPTNVRAITPYSSVNITCDGVTHEINLKTSVAPTMAIGKVDIVRGIGLEFNSCGELGGSGWSMASVGVFKRNWTFVDIDAFPEAAACSHYKPVASTDTSDYSISVVSTGEHTCELTIRDSRFSTLEAFHAWLNSNAVQIAAPLDRRYTYPLTQGGSNWELPASGTITTDAGSMTFEYVADSKFGNLFEEKLDKDRAKINGKDLSDGIDLFVQSFKSKNLIDSNLLEQGGLNSDGTEFNSSQRVRTGYVPVIPNTTYTCHTSNTEVSIAAVRCLNIEKNVISSINNPVNSNVFTFTTPTYTQYVRFVFTKIPSSSDVSPSDVTKLQLEEGDEFTGYVPYALTNAELTEKVTYKKIYFTPQNCSARSNYDNCYYFKENGIVHVHIGAMSPAAKDVVHEMATIPSGYRPKAVVASCGWATNNGTTITSCYVWIDSDGSIKFMSSGEYFILDFAYLAEG